LDADSYHAERPGWARTSAPPNWATVFTEHNHTVIAYARRTDEGWTLVAQQNYDEAYAPLRDANRNALILLAASIIFVGIVASALGSRLTHPIRNLTDIADHISRGELGAVIAEVHLLERATPKPQPGLPPTPELLALLQSAATDLADAADAGPRPVDEAVARSRAVIEAELTEYLGPMARVVVDEHVASAHDLIDFIDSLAGELDDPAKSAAFKLRVRERLASSAIDDPPPSD
jgi:HAMP domain-containing protein